MPVVESDSHTVGAILPVIACDVSVAAALDISEPEAAVLFALATDQSWPSTARRCGIGISGVSMRLLRLRTKASVHSNMALVAWAFRAGVLEVSHG